MGPRRGGRSGRGSARQRLPWLGHPMPVARLARAGVVALTLLVALSAVVPVAADSRIRKIEPRRVVPYRLGRAVTPNTDILSASGYAAWMIDEALEATTPLPRLGAAFMKAEREEGINARYFVAHAILETRWGRRPSPSASGTSSATRPTIAIRGATRHASGPTSRGSSRSPPRSTTGTSRRAALVVRVHHPPRRQPLLRLRPALGGQGGRPGQCRRSAHRDPLRTGLRFGRPTLTAAPTQGAALAVDVPWRARPGAELPPRIRFAVRWTPVALVEGSAVGRPTSLPRRGPWCGAGTARPTSSG